MRLTYIYHSGFAIEAANYTIIIDFFEDSINSKRGMVYDRLLHSPQRLYVLCTHGHSDHYNPDIMDWKERRSDITYIFSKDIETVAPKFQDINFLDRGDIFADDLLHIKAYGSTDLGVSFKITTNEGKVIFHAGDLNNWHWNKESTDGEIKEAENYYKNELDYLAASTPFIDLAMFPVDPRLGSDYMRGAEQLISRIPVCLFVPMHFQNEYDKAAEIKALVAKYNTTALTPLHRGEMFDNIGDIQSENNILRSK